MDIAFIGAGNVGRALAGTRVQGDDGVVISSKDLEEAQAVADEAGAGSAKTNRGAVEGAEAVGRRADPGDRGSHGRISARGWTGRS